MKTKIISFLVSSLFTLLLVASHVQAATITVTEKNDSFNMGNCSLRDAIQSVNTGVAVPGCVFTGSLASDNVITLEAGTYTLSLGSTDEDNNANGDLDILSSVTIQGAGSDLTNITGGFPSGEEDRIFDVCPNVMCTSDTTATLMSLTVNGGGASTFDSSGAGIKVLESFNPPGQIQLRLQDCQVRDNLLDLSGFSGSGGGILIDGGAEVLIERCSITGNQGRFGGGINNSNGTLAINESTIDDNEASLTGGGIQSGGDAILLLYNSTVSNNRALVSQIGSPSGGGIFISNDCNAASIIANSTISGNQARFSGGGVFVEACQSDTGLTSQVEGVGFIEGVFFFNATIAFNEATDANGEGGGIFFNPQQVSSILDETIATGNGGGVNLANTLLAQNQAETGPDCFSQLFSSPGFNLLGDTSNCVLVNLDPITSPDKLDIDPGIGALGDNGGPTFTHGLLDNSQAIDMANNNTGCQIPDFNAILDNFNFNLVDLTRDQRDFPRPIAVLDPNDPICDIGAFEFQVFDFTVTKDDGLDGETIPVDTTFDYTITVTNNGPGTATAVTLDDPIPAGMDFVSVTSSQGACAAIGQVIGCDLGDLAVGETATITVTVVATETGTFTNVVTVTLTNEFQEQLTETAQVTTLVGGLLVFGSGVHCGLQPGAVQASPGFALMFGLMSAVIFGIALTLRRKSHG